MRLRRELGVGLVVYVVWQYLVWLSRRSSPGPAMVHGRELWRLEGALHVRCELWLQQLVGHSSQLVQASNLYYDSAHVLGMALALVWAWRSGAAVYRQLRTVVLVVTGLALAAQSWQVAPLRVLGVGLIDTAKLRGVSIYELAHDKVDQFSAFPSLHVGWALVVSWVLLRHGRSWLTRLAALHGPVTALVVIVTGNHSVADVVAAAALVAASVAIVEGCEVYARRRSVRRFSRQHRMAGLPGVAVIEASEGVA